MSLSEVKIIPDQLWLRKEKSDFERLIWYTTDDILKVFSKKENEFWKVKINSLTDRELSIFNLLSYLVNKYWYDKISNYITSLFVNSKIQLGIEQEDKKLIWTYDKSEILWTFKKTNPTLKRLSDKKLVWGEKMEKQEEQIYKIILSLIDKYGYEKTVSIVQSIIMYNLMISKGIKTF